LYDIASWDRRRRAVKPAANHEGSEPVADDDSEHRLAAAFLHDPMTLNSAAQSEAAAQAI
jgi:hypothetical protein